MIRRFTIRLLVSLLLLASVATSAAPVLAATNPFVGVDCSKASDSAVCKTTNTTTNPFNSTIHSATLIIAGIAGAAAVIVMVLAGIRYITSDGDAEQVSRAKKTIIFAAVGLLLIAVGQTIINIVLGKV